MVKHQLVTVLNLCVVMSINRYNHSCIPVHGWIKETARVDNLVIPQRAGWITSYPPVINGYVIQTLNTNVKYKALIKAWR